MENMTKTLEYAKQGIRVNAIGEAGTARSRLVLLLPQLMIGLTILKRNNK
jgi:NAD(P)-dependent dehydrogenase (short-subunit alcohol dehydrogenase family)